MNRKGSVIWLSFVLVFSFIVIIVEIAPVVEAPTTWYVDDVPGSGPGNPAENFTSIQNAINAAQPGDTVFVYNGTYYENVVIIKKINLTGEDREETIIDPKGVGNVVHIVANWVNISGLQMMNSSNSGSGIYLQSSEYCKIEYCKYLDNEFDIYLDPLSNNNIIFNNICSSWRGINIDSSSNHKILNNTGRIDLSSSSSNKILNNTGDIILTSSSSNKILNNTGRIGLSSSSNNTIIYNHGAVSLDLSNGNIIENNNLSYQYGILLRSSLNNRIKNNTCIYCNNGIWLMDSSIGNIIENNTCNSNEYGIYVEDFSDSNKLLNNTCNFNDPSAIYIDRSSHNIVNNNNCSNNRNWGIVIRISINNTVENNVCNLNSLIDGIILGYSFGNTINNNTCNSNPYYGIRIYQSDNTIIDNNICLDNENGIYLTESDGGKITNNICNSNKENGIFLYDVSNITIEQNILSNNYRGIFSDSTSNSTIKNNICNSNILLGISLGSSNNNSLYHNHFVDNFIQAFDDGVNRWNLSYPTGGNYWSDFNEPHEGAYDDFKGQNQNVTGRDGIVDNGTIAGGGKNPYIIDSDSQDNYPLIGPSPYFPIENYTLLKQGWNLISIPLIQNNQNLTKVLESIEGYYDAVQWYDITDMNDPWKHYKVGKPFGNDLSKINEKMGFWIHITQPGDTIFLYNGTQPMVNQTITLHPGWNLVGYPSLTSYNRTDGLNKLTFGQEVDSIWTYDAATQKWKELGSSGHFKLRRGYWIHAKTTCVWEVPL